MHAVKAYFSRHKTTKDITMLSFFVITIVLLTLFINSYIFRVYSVVGASMEPTMHTSDRLFVNKLPVTFAKLTGHNYLPKRDQIIVFKNPIEYIMPGEEFIVKRVIGLPGERVVVSDGSITVFNDEHPDGFNPDNNIQGPQSPTSGNVDITVPGDELFVSGDNRIGNHSLDSRSGLSTIPLSLIEGRVNLRVFPFNKLQVF